MGVGVGWNEKSTKFFFFFLVSVWVLRDVMCAV